MHTRIPARLRDPQEFSNHKPEVLKKLALRRTVPDVPVTSRIGEQARERRRVDRQVHARGRNRWQFLAGIPVAELPPFAGCDTHALISSRSNCVMFTRS